MTNFTPITDLFFGESALDETRTQTMVEESLKGLDDGELFLEYTQSEALVFDDGQLKEANFDTSQGFGLRGVMGEGSAYAHSTQLNEAALKQASQTINSLRGGHNGCGKDTIHGPDPQASLYTDLNPLHEIPFDEKSTLLQEIDAYLRAKESSVKQVSASLAGEWQAIYIMKPEKQGVGDIRPLVRLTISVVVERDGRMERGGNSTGGREAYAAFIGDVDWKASADEALRQAMVNLEAVPSPAGEMQVVLGPGWPGVMLHEAVGHGLEGDFNRKGTSIFSGRVGERVASKGVTVVDDGTMPDRRGSLTIDDEGTFTSETVLIEDGILKGYMQDRLNARLMEAKPTGNGRRESFEHQPMPRMTNTFMLPGSHSAEEIISSVDKGIYATNFGGGQVDITSGKFVFSMSEAYKVENGKIKEPVKGATLIGSGPDIMQKIGMIGDDLALDPGTGTCGKDGQSVPVGVGQPTLRIDGITVGGTDLG